MLQSLSQFLLIAPPILLALTIHEVAHGWVAYKFGDPTAKMAGRLTLNPLPHLDVIGTILLFIAHIGWAKPVPVNPAYFKNPKRDLVWVSLAGPASNLLLAFGFGLIFRLIPHGTIMFSTGYSNMLIIMLIYAVVINLVLAVFNLIPIPPLDGSKILAGFLPREFEALFYQLDRIGPILVVGLVLLGSLLHIPILWIAMKPFIRFFSILFAGVDLSAL
jgi:Zn-dependent protease